MALGKQTYNANLPSGDLDEFLADMSQEKASYSTDEEEGLDGLFSKENEDYESEDNYVNEDSDNDFDEASEDESIDFDPQMAELSAEFAAMMTDLALPSLIASFIKCSPEKLQATKEQYAKLTSAYAQYLKTKQIKLSPGWMLIGVIVSVYATKIPIALQEQKLKEKEDELKKKEQELEARAREFEKHRAEEV